MPELIVEKQQEGVVLDQEHPWPGLVSFTEANQLFFFGREREVVELARLVRQETLTVFFGKSGLGKSSILRAGLSPLLRDSEFVPVYIRLNHDETAPSLKEQVEIAIDEALKEEKIDAGKPIDTESLWEYFHKKNNAWWDVENRLVKPVLIFDQFEELMTLGQENPERASRTASFLTQLEDLVENRPASSLVERFKSEPGLADQFDHRRSDYRVILSLREDFLPDLEGLRDRLRSIMFNRLRLLPMNGEQALDVILKPGRNLVDESVAIRIVDFISSSERSRLQKEVTRAQIAKRAIEPALLSVVLQELNTRRIRAGHEKITAELVGQTNPTEIFYDFYLRGLQGMDGAVREFIEDCLLTSSGARNRIAEEDALTKRGISAAVVTKLIDRRLVQRETTGSSKWLELTHDTLADVVRTDRAEHHQQRELELAAAREAGARRKLRQAQKLAIAFAVLLVIAAAALWRLTTRVQSQAHDTVEAVKKELDMPAPGAPERVKKAIERLSKDGNYFFLLRGLKREEAKALGYAAQILYFNGWIKDGCEYSDRAVKLADRFGSDPVSRANAHYARAQGQSKKGQLSNAEKDFRSAIELAGTSSSERAIKPAGRDRIHILAELGLGEVKSSQDSRGEAEKIFNQVRTEVRALVLNSPQKNTLEATISEVSALKGIGVIRERSGQINDNDLEAASAAEDFLQQADLKISKAVSEYPDNVILRNAEAETAYSRIFFLLTGSGRTNANYGPVAARLRDALGKGESLSNLDQQNRSWKFLLAQDYRLQGMMLRAAHEDIRALEAFKKLWDLAAEVQQSEPSWFINNYSVAIAESYMADCIATVATVNDLPTFRNCLAKLSGHDDSDFEKATISLSKTIAEINKNEDPSKLRQKRSSEAIANYRVEVYRRVQKNLEKLLQNSRDNLEYEKTKALTIDNIGDQEADQNHLPAAVAAYEEALVTLNGMPEKAAKLPDFEFLSATINESLGGVLLKIGGNENTRRALECRSKALKMRDDLLTSQPSVDNIMCSASAYIMVGDVYLAQGQTEKVKNFYQSAIHVYESALPPGDAGSSETAIDNNSARRAQLLRAKAQALNYIAYQWRTIGNLGEAAATLPRAIESAKEAFRIDPLNVEIISFLNGIKGDETNPNWEKFCKDQRNNALLSEDEKIHLNSIAESLDQTLPSQIPKSGTRAESLNWSILPLIPGSWHNLGLEEQEAEIRYLARSDIHPSLDPADISRIRTLGLPFYQHPDANLYEVELKTPNLEPFFLNYIRSDDNRGRLRDFSSISDEEFNKILNSDEQVDGIRLDGTAKPIRIFNSRHHPILENEVSAAVYLRLFCAAIQLPEGTFHIIDSQGNLHWKPNAEEKVRQGIEERIYPLKIKATPEGWEAKATIAYSNYISYALLKLSSDGLVQMPAEEKAPIKDLTKAEGLPVVPEQFVKGFRLVSSPLNDILREKIQGAGAAIQDKKWQDAVNFFKDSIDLLSEQKSNEYKTRLIEILVSLSWCQLHTKDFAGALASTEAGKKIDADYLPLETNRAHALLFLGKINEAEEIYRKYIGQKIETDSAKTWEQTILEDFETLEKDGLHHLEFARIRGILKAAGH